MYMSHYYIDSSLFQAWFRSEYSFECFDHYTAGRLPFSILPSKYISANALDT